MDLSSTSGRRGSAAIVALLLVQFCIGYEWLVSGLTKLVHGDFPSGLAAELRDMSSGAPGWYRSFLDSAVLPHAAAFGYAIEIAELAVGVVLLVAVLRLPAWVARHVPVATGVALVVGLFLAVNFALANGSSFGLGLAGDSFDEGIDLDTLLVGVQLALLVVAVAEIRRVRSQVPISNSRSTSFSDIRLWDSSRQPTISGVGKP
jgi:thiosulfate dehydrogenase [quinone] large subunit